MAVGKTVEDKRASETSTVFGIQSRPVSNNIYFSELISSCSDGWDFDHIRQNTVQETLIF